LPPVDGHAQTILDNQLLTLFGRISIAIPSQIFIEFGNTGTILEGILIARIVENTDLQNHGNVFG
jgi:hypothetical protein